MLRTLPVLIALGLAVYCAIDCIRTPDDEIKSMPKIVWLMIILLVWLVGPIIWLLAGRDRGAAGRPVARGPLPPDDDPEFLRRLAEQRRLRSWEDDLRRREQRLGGDDEETV